MSKDKPIGVLETKGVELTEEEKNEFIELMESDKSIRKITFTNKAFTINISDDEK